MTLGKTLGRNVTVNTQQYRVWYTTTLPSWKAVQHKAPKTRVTSNDIKRHKIKIKRHQETTTNQYDPKTLTLYNQP